MTKKRKIETSEETAARDAAQREFEANALREDARRRAEARADRGIEFYRAQAETRNPPHKLSRKGMCGTAN